MSEEELNQELSTDKLKDVAGGLTEAVAQSKTRFRNKYEPKGDLLGKKGRKQTNTNLGNFAEPDLDPGDSPYTDKSTP